MPPRQSKSSSAGSFPSSRPIRKFATGPAAPRSSSAASGKGKGKAHAAPEKPISPATIMKPNGKSMAPAAKRPKKAVEVSDNADDDDDDDDDDDYECSDDGEEEDEYEDEDDEVDDEGDGEEGEEEEEPPQRGRAYQQAREQDAVHRAHEAFRQREASQKSTSATATAPQNGQKYARLLGFGRP